MKGGAEPPFIFDHPAAAALSAETKAEGPAAKPPGGDAESYSPYFSISARLEPTKKDL